MWWDHWLRFICTYHFSDLDHMYFIAASPSTFAEIFSSLNISPDFSISTVIFHFSQTDRKKETKEGKSKYSPIRNPSFPNSMISSWCGRRVLLYWQEKFQDVDVSKHWWYQPRTLPPPPPPPPKKNKMLPGLSLGVKKGGGDGDCVCVH